MASIIADAHNAPVTKDMLRAALEAERREILAFYRSLAPDDWRQPSLCALWTVREVLAHLVTNDSTAALFLAMLRTGLKGDVANLWLVARLRERTYDELLAAWEQMVVPRGTPAAAPGPYLADDWVHHQDIRWPLNRPRLHDPVRLRLVLDELLKLNRKRVSGLRLVAADLGWAAGDPSDPLVEGTAEALAMGIANRSAALARLRGPGADQIIS
ncbi:MAG TPA: maleylpyruvate isomerase family mycothiol-dependent enzyme [Ktedonobacterales bacterium]|nr:maleylpyruvate isomerase family mycothiol-dependent enzyme [Ktedonobacterales bacterium]